MKGPILFLQQPLTYIYKAAGKIDGVDIKVLQQSLSHHPYQFAHNIHLLLDIRFVCAIFIP
jgi:hypothetical protein